MKQATITTQVIHTVEFDETKFNPELVAEYIAASVQEATAEIESPIMTLVETEVIKDSNPVIVPLWS